MLWRRQADLRRPAADGSGDWLTFAWVFLLGVDRLRLLGIAVSAVAKRERRVGRDPDLCSLRCSSSPGCSSSISQLPKAMVTVASLFPVKWICQGFRSVFLPDEMRLTKWRGHGNLG